MTSGQIQIIESERRVMSLTTRVLMGLLTAAWLSAGSARADQFRYIDEDGKTVEVEARLYGTGQGAIAMELGDGSLRLVPQEAVQKRVPGNDPKPMAPEAMLERLTDEFGKDKFRGTVIGQYVVGVVLTAPLPKSSEGRVQTNLKKAARYMRGIEAKFKRFCISMRVPHEEPKFPLVVLIFETDDDFEEYTQRKSTGGGLSAGNIAGFYSSLTNRLNVRMSECYTFATPLHEAIHQQCFNTGVLSRLAPIPVWFAEGIATGFEGTGDSVRSDPQQLAAPYAKQLMRMGGPPRGMSWSDVVTTDAVFRGDIFAGEAYLHAWSMHWLLVSRYRREYGEYLKYLNTLEPLSDVSERVRLQRFEEAFGKSPTAVQRDFVPSFNTALKRTKFPEDPNDRPGIISRQTNLAGVDVYAESNGGTMNIEAQLRNISPLREMSFYVVVYTGGGQYVDWFLPRMKINQFTKLQPKLIQGGARQGFNVQVLSTPADSDVAARWARGQLPQVRRR